MKMRFHTPAIFPAMILGAALLTMPAASFGQQDQNTPKQDMQNAGHATKNATKDAANGTNNESKKGYNATKSGARTVATRPRAQPRAQ